MLIVTEEYKKWRAVIFNATPEQVGVSSQDKERLFGLLMDIGQQDTAGRGEFALSLTAFASGEASFRPTPGGGVVGLGGEPKIAQAAQILVQMGQATLAATRPTEDFTSLPAPGRVRFTYLTTSGVRAVEGDLNAMLNPQSPFSQMMKGFGIIRNFAEQMNAKRG